MGELYALLPLKLLIKEFKKLLIYFRRHADIVGICVVFVFLSFRTEAQSNQTVTNGAAVIAVSLAGSPCVYSWVNNNPAIGLAASGTGNIPSFTAVNTGNSPVTATITATSVEYAYIANFSTNNVFVVNTATNAVIDTIPVGNGPYAVAVSPDGTRAYVTNYDDATVSVINTVTNTVIATIVVGVPPQNGMLGTDVEQIVVSPDNSRVYVACFNAGTNQYISVINTLTNTVINSASFDSIADYCMAISPDGTQLFFGTRNPDPGQVLAVSTSTLQVLATITVGLNPYGVAVSPDGSLLYVVNSYAGAGANTQGSVSVVNIATYAVVATIPVGNDPIGIGLSPDGARAYVTNTTSGTVSVINTVTKSVVATVTIGGSPVGISVSLDNSKVYVEGKGTAIISVATDAVIANIGPSDPNDVGNFITAGAGCGTVTFTITVDPSPSLSGLTISQGTLTPAFAAGTNSYTASVPNKVTSLIITPTTASSTNTITINNIAVVSGSASAAIPLTVGANVLSVVVTAPDGVTKITYTVTVTRAPSSDATLAGLTLSAGTLTPAFAAGTTVYTASVGSAVSSLTLTPTAGNSGATVTVNNTIVASGNTSAAIPLTVGNNTLTVRVTSQDGSTTQTYTITVNRPVQVVISYVSPQIYTVNAAISPLSPTSSNVAVQGYGTPVSLGSGFSLPTGVAIDASGNIYEADNTGVIKEIPAGGGSVTTFATGFSHPQGLAVDVSGNVYVSDMTNAVYKIPAGGGTAVTLATGFGVPQGITLDAAGNVYVADYSNNAVRKIPAGGGSVTTIGSGFILPTGVAVDGAGNVYVCSIGSEVMGTVQEVPANGGSIINLVSAGSVKYPENLVIDGGGNLYITDSGNNLVREIPAGGGSLVTLGSGFLRPQGIALDASGNLYIGDYSNDAVKEMNPVGGYYINPALPAGLIFSSSTGVISGTPIAKNPSTNYTVTAYNTGISGTATLNITVKYLAPTISYSSPVDFVINTAINPITPTSSGVAAPAYGSPIPLTSGFAISGVAVDNAGNIYVGDQTNNEVKKIPAGGGVPVVIATFTNPGYPGGIGVDGLGNVYVADPGDETVVKIPPGGAQTVIYNGTSLSSIAADQAGDLYLTDNITTHTGIKEIVAGTTTAVTIEDGYIYTPVIALDNNGNLYSTVVVDPNQFSASIFKRTSDGTETTVGTLPQYSVSPIGLTVDATGDIFTTDGSAIYEFPVGVATATALSLSDNSIWPGGIAVDNANKLYFADINNNMIKVLSPAGGYYISPALPAGLSFSSTTGTVSGTPTILSPQTNYTVTAYNPGGGTPANLSIVVSSGPLPMISYSSPQTYTVGIAIPALKPAGSGVAAAGYSGAPVIIGSGLSGPFGIAADAAGNIYVTNFNNNTVNKLPVGGGAAIPLGSGFSNPAGIAVDAAGNVYVADVGNNAIKEIPVGGGAPVTLGSGFRQPEGVAVDAAGNVYVGDTNNNEVKEIPAGGGYPTLLGYGYNGPVGVAVDAVGNVYVADVLNNAVKEIPAGGGTPVTLESDFNRPYGVAVDATGNVYIADTNNGEIKEIPVGSGTSVIIGSGFNSPYGVAVDAAGDVYLGDYGNSMVKEIKPVGGYYLSAPLPEGLSFNNNTGVISGTPTVISPATSYTVTAYNSNGGIWVNVSIQTVANATLSGLVLSNGTLSPAFTGGATSYTASVSNATTSITVTPTASDPNATVTVNSVTVGSGTASGAVALNVGVNTINTIVTASDGVTTKAYTVAVTRLPSVIATLAGLTTSSGTLSPAFATGTTSYSDKVNNTVTSIAFRATTTSSSSTETINGTTVPEGTVSPYFPLNVGLNTITVVVTAQDGVTKDTYTIGVTRLSNVATLSGLTTSSGTLTPAFATATTSYTDNVANAVTSIAFRATTTSSSSTETINGTPVPEGTVSPYFPLNVGLNTITIIVTAQDGVTKDTYTIGVTRVSNIATLSKLTISDGTLSPAFATGTTSYTDKVIIWVDSIAVRAITTDPTATETINGKSVPEGTVSPYITLNVGLNNISIVVTAQDGITKDTYTIAVTRLSNIATLSKLTISNGTLSLAFATGTTSYTDVAHSVSSIAFRATTTDPLATETINGTAVPEGTVSPYIPLNVGVNNISVIVTAQDGVTQDAYTIAVTRLPEIATLSKLTVSNGTLTPAFATATTSYTDVAHAVSSIAFRATTTDPLATETINGTTVPEGTVSPYIPLNAGVNNISIIVTAQDGVTKDTYTIAVTRLPEVATLSKLTISSGTLTPAFASGTTSYTDVAHAVSSLAFRATTTDALATETINGTAVPEGTVSPYIPLSVGVNNISVVVTAQDGLTKDTYTIAVTRLPEIATLAGLTISSGTLSPAFATATTSYTDNVANTATSIAFRATTTDPLATETISGTAVPEGTVSFYVPLSVGLNKISVIVTAQDGVTTETYTVAVTRAAPPGANIVYQPVSVETTTETPQLANDGVMVHRGVSPNGDGIDDFLKIDNITNYPDNRLAIMNRNGMLVYEAKGYDNASNVFDGHSNKNGAMQLPGTYFYELDYTVNGIIKHKTGFLVLKY
jgi:gliding motility-associated-like protein